MAIDFTTVIAVDQNHIESLSVVTPVWRKNAPEIWQQPMLAMIDGEAGHAAEQAVRDMLRHDRLTTAMWNPGVEYAGQREKMLTTFVCLAPHLVSTTFWAKIDLDALPVRRDPAWLDEKWFTGDPCYIAPSWSYTCVKYGSPVAFDDWADKHPALSSHPRTGIVPEPGARRVRHPRMCSWLSFYSTAWTRWAADLLPGRRMPIPSQDGFHSLLALRVSAFWRHYPAKRLGWTNTPRLAKLRELAAGVLSETS